MLDALPDATLSSFYRLEVGNFKMTCASQWAVSLNAKSTVFFLLA